MATTQRPDVAGKMGRGNPGSRGKFGKLETDSSVWGYDYTVALGSDPTDKPYGLSNVGLGDAINAEPIRRIQADAAIPNDAIRDLIKFNIKVIDPLEPNNVDLLVFRAYLDDVSDDYTANHNQFKYNGRAEKFYTYSEFDRSISFSFRIQAQSRQEMKPLHQKLNYLVAQTAPSYSNGRMRAKFARLTIGDWMNEIPGLFTNISLNWKGAYSWEIDSDGGVGQDKLQMNQLPHQLDVKCSFKPVHDFAPENDQNRPFILPHRGIDDGQKWTNS